MRRFMYCILLLTIASSAGATGGFVGHGELTGVQAPRQRALIVFDDGLEDLVLEVDYDNALEDFAWLIPLPNRPEIRAVERETFEMLAAATRLADRGRSIRVGYAANQDESAEVAVLERKIVGAAEIAVLAGGAGGGLADWLREQGFELPDRATPIIDDYLARGWLFAAVRVATTPAGEGAVMVEKVVDGTIQPLLFRFASEEPVYPLGIGAITGGPADVRLYIVADEPMACANAGGVDWRVDVHGRIKADEFAIPDHLAHHAGTSVRRDTLYYVTETAARHFAAERGAVLTRLSADVAPEQMADLSFAPLSMIEELAADDLNRRSQAATYLGARPSREAVVPLLEMMWRSNAALIDQDDAMQYFRSDGVFPDQDVVSALWALGRIGAPEALEDVKRWAQGENSRCALEALNTLGELAPASATESALDVLAGERAAFKTSKEEEAIVVWAKDWLIANGGPECRETLEDIVDDRYTAKAWTGYNLRTVDRNLFALLAAAAADVELAQDILKDHIRAAVMELDAPGRPGLIGNYPTAVAMGAAILHSRYGSGGAPLIAVEDHLAERPDVLSELFRGMAHEAGLATPANGVRAVLLAKLPDLDARDAELLGDIWKQALEQPRRMRTRFRGTHAPSDTVTYNVDAVAAAYAMGLQGRTADLLDCWREVGWEDPDLKGELALALALTDDPAGAPAVLEYVRTIWNRNAAVPSLREALARVAPPPFDWPDSVPLDLRYRVQPLAEYLAAHAWPEIAALVADESLDPLHRAFWALDPLPWWDDPTARYVTVLRDLRDLVDSELLVQRLDWKIDQAERTMALQGR